MDKVGVEMRKVWYWVSDRDIVYLMVDNAGESGANNTIPKYTIMSLEKHHIIAIRHVMHSLHFNIPI